MVRLRYGWHLMLFKKVCLGFSFIKNVEITYCLGFILLEMLEEGTAGILYCGEW